MYLCGKGDPTLERARVDVIALPRIVGQMGGTTRHENSL